MFYEESWAVTAKISSETEVANILHLPNYGALMLKCDHSDPIFPWSDIKRGCLQFFYGLK